MYASATQELLARRSQIRVERTVPSTCSAMTWHMIQTLPPLTTEPTFSDVDERLLRMVQGVPPLLAVPVPATVEVCAAAAAGAVVVTIERQLLRMLAAASTVMAVRR